MVRSVKLRIKMHEVFYEALKQFAEKYKVSVDEAIEMAIARAFLQDRGLIFVPAEVLYSKKGIVFIDDEKGVVGAIPFKVDKEE